MTLAAQIFETLDEGERATLSGLLTKIGKN
jgi:hypothetical protein